MSNYTYYYGIYTCKLISSVLNGTEQLALPDNMNIDDLYHFQCYHDITNIAFVGLKQLDLPEEKIKEFEQDYKKNILREARFEIDGEKVFDALEKAEIPFIPIKGAILKYLYPKVYYRYFTDYDVFIGDRCSEVQKVMEFLGYEYDHDTENDMDFVKKPSLHFEMHHSLFTQEYDFGGYFNEPFEKSVVKEGKKYYHLLRDEDHFIYIFAHLYKHFTDGGCGIKQFLDIYLMTKKLTLNMEYIRNELKKIGLEQFLNTALRLNVFLFDGAEPNNELMQIADYVFNNGTFGNVRNSMALDYAQDTEITNQKFGLYKIKFFANRWQLSFSGMKKQYHILAKLPFLLPFCYLHKLFRVLFFRRDVLKTQVKDINDFSDDYSAYIRHILDISGARIENTKDRNNG